MDAAPTRGEAESLVLGLVLAVLLLNEDLRRMLTGRGNGVTVSGGVRGER